MTEQKLLDLVDQPPADAAAAAPILQVRHLSMDFDEAEPLKDINFDVFRGDIIAIIGPSGTGKSTLLRCINQLDEPTTGTVLFNGQDLTDEATDLAKERQHIGMVFQHFNLFSHRMVIENIMMPQIDLLGRSEQEAYDKGMEQLAAVGLTERSHAYPDEISGGQKQRVAIARCLAMEPEIILFDEPTSALDPAMVAEVEAVIGRLAEAGLTMMIVTHDMHFAKNISTRVFYLDEGVIYEQGTPEEIFDNPQTEKARAFVKRLFTFQYDIESRTFDTFEFFAGIKTFCRRRYLREETESATEHVAEELLLNKILPVAGACHVELQYFEGDDSTEFVFEYPGESFDPFDEGDEDELDIPMMLARAYTQGHEHDFDADAKQNRLRVKVGKKASLLEDADEDAKPNISLDAIDDAFLGLDD